MKLGCQTSYIKLIANRWAWRWCLPKWVVIPGSNEPWATSPEQGTQASTATLRAATTQRQPQGCLEGKGAANRDDVEPAPPPKNTQAPAPSSIQDTGQHLPRSSKADHEMRPTSLLTKARGKQGAKSKVRSCPSAARNGEASACCRNWARNCHGLPGTTGQAQGRPICMISWQLDSKDAQSTSCTSKKQLEECQNNHQEALTVVSGLKGK